MASSPESNRSLSDGEAGSRTPTQATNAQLKDASELSPPGSQSQPTGGMDSIAKDKPSVEAGTTDSTQQAGASWMNRRAEEEYQRAMEYVIDLDFSLG